MRKITLTLVLAISASLGCMAQVGLHIGAHGQFNSVWILNQDNYQLSQMDYEYKLGGAGGVSFGYNWLPNYGAQIEFNYAIMGQNYSDIVRDFSLAYNPDITNQLYPVLTYRYVDLKYLQVPLLFKYMEGESKDAIKYHMYGGLQFGFLMSAEQLYTADIHDDGNQVDIDASIAPENYVPEFSQYNGTDFQTLTANGTNLKAPKVDGKDYFTGFDIGLLIDIGVDIYANDHLYFSPALRMHYGFLDMNSEPTRNLEPAKGENIYKGSHNAFAGIVVGINFMMPDVVFGPKE
ncbi:MAG: outer membrane beta-barrel protein [Chitinophagales bacterium]